MQKDSILKVGTEIIPILGTVQKNLYLENRN